MLWPVVGPHNSSQLRSGSVFRATFSNEDDNGFKREGDSVSRTSDSVRRQLERIIALGYPQIAGMSAEAFRALAVPLLGALDSVDVDEEILLVPTSELVSPDSLIARTSIGRNAGFSTMPPRDIESFAATDTLPEGPFYVVIDPHTGSAYKNREPDVARKLIDADGKEPLTLEEGLALATQHPDWLVSHQGFALTGSRSADGRVPGIWMSQHSPRLGSMWPTSKHTWIGNAYCTERRGVSLLA